MCCTQAKLALPAGGTPNCQRLSSRKRSLPQSLMFKGRIGEDEVGLEVGVTVVVEGVAVGNLAVNAANREVHFGKPPGGVVALLAVNADVAFYLTTIPVTTLVRVDEFD